MPIDLTGGLTIYGIQQSKALHLAVADINSHGGVLGQPVQIVESDAQSEQSKYTQYANTMIMRDHIAALFAGLASSSREAIRPVARRGDTLYFYSSLYEGGVCDGNTFVTGPSASQQLKVLIKWSIEKYGKRIYIMAADFNFGTISAAWVRAYAKEFGAEVVGADFIPLTVTDFSSTIQKIEAAHPDFVFALPVGANQTGFLEQFAAAGLKKKIIKNDAGKLRDLGGGAAAAGACLHVRDSGECLVGDKLRTHYSFRGELLQILLFATFCIFVGDIDAGQYGGNCSDAAQCDRSRNKRKPPDHFASPVVDDRGGDLAPQVRCARGRTRGITMPA